MSIGTISKAIVGCDTAIEASLAVVLVHSGMHPTRWDLVTVLLAGILGFFKVWAVPNSDTSNSAQDTSTVPDVPTTPTVDTTPEA